MQDGFYSKDGEKCKKCTICHRGQKKLHDCSIYRNRECECNDGKYEARSICVDCKDCLPGFRQVRDCAHNLNRECVKCPPGMTTNTTNSLVCITNYKKPTDVNINIHKHVSSSVDWRIILSILSAVVIMIIIVGVVYFKWYKRKVQRRAARNAKRNCNGAEENIAMLPIRTIQDIRNSENDINGSSMLPIPSFTEEPIEGQVMFRDMSFTITEELAAKLNPRSQRNWRTLAGLIGMTNEDVGRLELNPQEATQDLLHEWGTQRNSTVNNLYSLLCSMGRIDAAQLLEPYICR